MKKKRLKGELRDAGARIQQLADLLAAERRGRDEQHEAMLAAGYLYVGPNRTAGDRIRAAQRGVLILDDVQILASPTFTIEQDQIDSSLFGNFVTMPGRTHHRVSIEFEGEGAVVDALGNHIAEHTSARPRRIHP